MSSTSKSKPLTQENLLNKYLETKDTLGENIEPELEIRFGTRNISKITKNNFDSTIQFLLAKNFYFEPNERYYLNIKADDIRVEVDNLINIQSYCKTNQLPTEYPQPGYSFTEKSIYNIDGSIMARVNLDDFNFRITYSTEKKISPDSEEIQTLIKEWPQKKLFNRLINRYTLLHEDYPVKVDFSIVRESSNSLKISESNLFKSIPKYEIEIEIINDKVKDYDLEQLNRLVKNVSKYVLCGLQNSNFPVSYGQLKSVSEKYLLMIGVRHKDITPSDFIGPSSITLQISNITESNPNSNIVNIRKNYTVTDKADGERKLLYIDDGGKIYLINTQVDIQFTGAQTKNPDLFETLIDGEHIKHNKLGSFINLYAAFDIYFLKNKDLRSLEFIGQSKADLPSNFRFDLLNSTIKLLQPVLVNSDKSSPINIQIKEFYDITPTQSLFDACNLINSNNLVIQEPIL